MGGQRLIESRESENIEIGWARTRLKKRKKKGRVAKKKKRRGLSTRYPERETEKDI